MTDIISSIWGSITKETNALIAAYSLHYPDSSIMFVDWEAHANIEELPDTDLIGPTSLVVMEVSPQMFDVNFAIGVSTYSTDENLFRLRWYVSQIFSRFRPMKQLKIYDSETAEEFGYLICADGTGAMPMTRSTTRPFQYVQVNGLLEPGAGDS